jgi:hypothetical protein
MTRKGCEDIPTRKEKKNEADELEINQISTMEELLMKNP